jgi:hypothetical protein
MTALEPQPPTPPPRPPFQFSLRTLLLLCVVLGSSLAVFGAWGIVVFGGVLGLAVYICEAEPLWSWARLALVVIVLLGLAALLTPINSADEARRHESCANNLHGIALALLEYHEANGCFPPAFTADKSGKPLHSWRTLILPYMDCDDLCKACDLTQPWDAPKNQKLLAFQLRRFVCPNDPSSNAYGATQTNYFAVVGPNAAWAGANPRKLADFGKDAFHTIIVVESANSGVLCAEPRDFSLDLLGTAPAGSPAISSNHGLSGQFFFIYVPGVNVAMADGTVRFLHTGNRSADDLRKILQIGGYTDAEINSDEDYLAGWRPNWPNIAALAVWLLSVGTLLVLAVRSRKPRSVSANPPIRPPTPPPCAARPRGG